MSASNFSELRVHAGHRIEVVVYGDEENVSIECLDCHEVILSFDSDEADDEQQD